MSVMKHGKPAVEVHVPQHTYDPTTIGYGDESAVIKQG